MDARLEGLTQETAAAKAGISERSGRRIDQGQRQPRVEPREWRTREDPLAAVWDGELVPLLQNAPELTGLSLLEYLDERYPGQYSDALLRTLQRRVKQWRAVHGPDKAVIFRQTLPPGRMGLSDFTHPDTTRRSRTATNFSRTSSGPRPASRRVQSPSFGLSQNHAAHGASQRHSFAPTVVIMREA